MTAPTPGRAQYDDAIRLATQAAALVTDLRAALELPADCPAVDVVAAATDYRHAAARAVGHSSAADAAPLITSLRASLQVDATADVDDLLAVAADYREAASRLPAVQAALDEVWPLAQQLGAQAKHFSEALEQRAAEQTALQEEVTHLRATVAATARDEVLGKAASEGRITPHERRQMAALWTSNPTAVTDLIAARPKNSAVPVTPIGHDGEGNDDDDIYARLFPALGQR